MHSVRNTTDASWVNYSFPRLFGATDLTHIRPELGLVGGSSKHLNRRPNRGAFRMLAMAGVQQSGIGCGPAGGWLDRDKIEVVDTTPVITKGSFALSPFA
jgi:hypothetical protein